MAGVKNSLFFKADTGIYTDKKNEKRYCSKCIQDDKPNEVVIENSLFGKYHCPSCNSNFTTPAYREDVHRRTTHKLKSSGTNFATSWRP